MFKVKANQIFRVILVLILTTSAVHLVFGQSDGELEREETEEDNNSTISDLESEESPSNNSTDDYDYEEGRDGSECEDNQPTFLDKWKEIYEQGKNVAINKHVDHINDTSEVLKTFKQNLQFLLKPSEDSQERYKALEFFTEIDLGLSNDCLTAFTRMLMAVGNGELWALKFIDSMGRPFPSGFAEGLQSHFGEYSECLDIVSPKSEDRATINGRYCLMNAILPFPSIESYRENESVPDVSIFSGLLEHYGLGKLSTIRAFIEGLNLSNGSIYRMGICIPSQCSAQEFQHLLNALLFPITRIPIEVGPQCHVKDERITLDKYQIISISFFSISSLLIILSTGYEIYINQKLIKLKSAKSEGERVGTVDNNQLLTSFSIIRNTRILFAKNKNFAALDTFRLLFIINVHMGHAFTYTTSLGVIGLKKIFSEVMSKVYEDNEYIFVRNPLIIDALFTLSGFLLSFGVLRKLDKTRGHFNYIEFIFQRWIRFFVLMFGGILFFYLFPLTGDGPIWDIGIGWVTPGCQNPKNLLKMLFFVHNFRDDLKEQYTIANSKCNPPTWFLSSLLQLTLIGPIFIVIYHKKKFFGIIALISAILLSVFSSIAPQILFHIRPYLQIWELESVFFSVSKSYTWWHFTPNNYGTAFFIGIGFGYLMRKNIQISRSKSGLYWVLSIVLCTLIYFWHNSFWRLDQSAPLISVLLWQSVGKLVFCLGFGWIYFACCTGRGGYFNQMLSWQGFQPIARLSFGIYILHYLVVMHRVFTIHYTYVMSDKYMFEHLIVDFVYDIILAYFFYILIESPFFNVFNHFMGPKVRSVDKTSSEESNSESDKMNNNSFIDSKKALNGCYDNDIRIYSVNDYSKNDQTKL